MKQSSRLFVTLALKTQPKRRYKPKPLKEISTRTLWIILDSIKHQLKNRLFLHPAQVEGLEKRERDLSIELDSRLEQEDYMCSIWPKEFEGQPQRKYWEDGRLVENELLAIRDEDSNRKGKSKVYIRGSRLRPGKKVDARYRRRI